LFVFSVLCCLIYKDVPIASARAREQKNDGFPAPRKVWSRVPLCRIRESPPAPLPTAVATMLLPRYFYQDLARGKQRRSPRRNFRGAERPPFQLSLTRGGPRRHTCPPVPTLRGLVF